MGETSWGGCTFGGSVWFDSGLLGELQAEAMIDSLCAEGCPCCGKALQREGLYKCSCPTCHIGLELLPPGTELPK